MYYIRLGKLLSLSLTVVGSVEKIISSISERAYGRHTYRAAILIRQGVMLGGMLTNAETWINITEADITRHRFLNCAMPDSQLQRRLISVSGNPSKVLMCLELGFVLVKFVIMAKRKNIFPFILK